MKLRVPEQNYGLTQFYDMVATIMGNADVSKLHYDCREINVAPNIQDGFFAYYQENQQNVSEIDVAMMLLTYGPKVDDSLADYEVTVSDQFIY